MKHQHLLTLVGITVSSVFVNSPHLLAANVLETDSISVNAAKPKTVEQRFRFKKAYYAYNQPSELVENLKKHESNISCYVSADNPRLSHYQIWLNRGIALQQQQKYRESIGCFDLALSLQPDLEQAWYRRGVAFSYLKQYSQASFAYQQAIKLNGNEYSSWYNQANAYKHLGKYEKAIAAFKQAIALKPDFHAAHYYLAGVL